MYIKLLFLLLTIITIDSCRNEILETNEIQTDIDRPCLIYSNLYNKSSAGQYIPSGMRAYVTPSFNGFYIRFINETNKTAGVNVNVYRYLAFVPQIPEPETFPLHIRIPANMTKDTLVSWVTFGYNEMLYCPIVLIHANNGQPAWWGSEAQTNGDNWFRYQTACCP